MNSIDESEANVLNDPVLKGMLDVNFVTGLVLLIQAFSLANLGLNNFSFDVFFSGEVTINIALVHPLIIYLGTAGLMHMLVTTVFRQQYKLLIISKSNKFRWLEYTFSYPFMIVAMAIALGVNSGYALMVLFLASMALNPLGWIIENGKSSPSLIGILFVVGTVLAALPFAYIFLTIDISTLSIFTNRYSQALLYVMFLLYSLFPAVLFLSVRRIGLWKEYANVDLSFMALSLFSKSFLAWSVYVGLIS